MVNAERYQQIRRTFESLLDLTDDERAMALDMARAGDPELAREVEALMAAYRRRSAFIEEPVTSLRQPEGVTLSSVSGTAFGSYQLQERIGEGGMGEVWRAEQLAPVQRTVAVKLIKLGMDTREAVLRFELERQALALMDHPAIAKVFDAGSTPEGRVYFAMEYVPGEPITTYCDRHKLTIEERLRLFIRGCEGVQHAHQKAILHRDLKPSNILVAHADGKPRVKIIDFGIARAMTRRLAGETFETNTGVIVGTLDYMSPEQAMSGSTDIDTRADVYSLGVVLYELLVDVRPFDLRNLAFDERLRVLRESDAERPSTKIRSKEEASQVYTDRCTDSEKLTRELRGDLDAIALKALEKDRSRRYDSPLELAEDIKRHLRSEPVAARPASFAYRARKYVRRNRLPVAFAALLIVLVIGFGVVQATQIRRVTRERDRADRVTRFMTQMFRVSNPSESHGNRVTAREILDKASAEISAGLTNDPETKARLMDAMGTVYHNLGLYTQAVVLLDEGLTIRKRLLGANHPDTAQTMSNLARALNASGRRIEAEKLDREALDIRTRLLGPDDPQTLISMNNLAGELLQSGRYPEAVELHRHILDARRRVLGPEHPDTLTSLDNLGAALNDQGRYGESEVLEREALTIKRRVLGPEHPDTLRAIHHLANTLYDEGRAVEAEKLYLEVLGVRQRVLGPSHVETMNAMIALANALDDEGRYAEAERFNRRAADSERDILGPEHPDTLLALNNLAELLADEGKLQEAEKIHRTVLDARRRILGQQHAYALYSMGKLALVLIAKGDLDQAESLSRTARDAQTRVLGALHPDIAEMTYNLAAIAARRNHSDQAVAELRTAIVQGLKPRVVLRIQRDPNFKTVAGDAQFRSLVAAAQEEVRRATAN